MNNYDEEIGKYVKKKQSNISKSKEKSKHKHIYEECLMVDKDNSPHHATYCTICGKIGNIAFWDTEKLDNGCYRMLNDNEVFEKYKNLNQIHINDVWQKYVALEVKKEN